MSQTLILWILSAICFGVFYGCMGARYAPRAYAAGEETFHSSSQVANTAQARAAAYQVAILIIWPLVLPWLFATEKRLRMEADGTPESFTRKQRRDLAFQQRVIQQQRELERILVRQRNVTEATLLAQKRIDGLKDNSLLNLET